PLSFLYAALLATPSDSRRQPCLRQYRGRPLASDRPGQPGPLEMVRWRSAPAYRSYGRARRTALAAGQQHHSSAPANWRGRIAEAEARDTHRPAPVAARLMTRLLLVVP